MVKHRKSKKMRMNPGLSEVEIAPEPANDSSGEVSNQNSSHIVAPLTQVTDSRVENRSSTETSPSEASLQADDNDSRSNESSTQSGLQSLSTQAPRASKSKKKGKVPTARVRRRARVISRSPESVGSERSEDDMSLYDKIVDTRSSLKEIAERWIEDYKNDKDSALLMLRQYFISSTGCKGRITPEMRDLENTEVISRMAEEFDPEGPGDYPLVMTGKKWQNFRKRFAEFVEVVLLQCQHSIIYDQVLLVDARSLLIELSDSQVRAFRHTATLAAMKLMTALVDVAAGVSRSLAISKRQLKAEKQRSASNSVDRLENLEAKIEEFEENFADLKDNINSLFSSVFVRRYIDILDDIRVICICEVPFWLEKFPEYFVNDRYLKYVGWILYDKAPEVRYQCVRTLQPLYDSDTFKSRLEGFTSRFKDRMFAMVLDKDFEVAAMAIELVTSLLLHYPEFLTDQDCERVFELVYSSNRGVAQAAGIFLKERLFTLDNNDENAVVRSRRGKQRLPNTPLIRDLILFFIEAELHEHAAYLVDSLIDSNPMIKDWECMIDLLLEDAGPDETPLNNQTETCLIEIMVCSVKQAATGASPVGRTPARKIQSRSDQLKVYHDRQNLTEHLIGSLPTLLAKYRADPEKLGNLLSVPQYFDLTMYVTTRDEQSLNSLLTKINEIVANVQNAEVLAVAAKTLEFMCADDSPIREQSSLARSMFVDSLIAKYKSAIAKYRNLITEEISPNETELFDVVQSLKKISIFYSSHDMNWGNIQDSLFKDLEDAKDPSRNFPNEAVVYCITACRFAILWSQNRLMSNEEDRSTDSEDETRRLSKQLHSFIGSLKYIVKNGVPGATSNPEIRDEAYSTICDLLVLFSSPMNVTNSLLDTLVYEDWIDEEMQSLLNRFIQERVFTEIEDGKRDEESKIEELHDRRNLLAGYCKLVVFNILAPKWAADVFKHYVRFYNDYGDIIKATLGKARSINKVNCALAMQQSLKILYEELLAEKAGLIKREYKEFRAIKELARRFGLLFGFQAAQNRDAVTALHRAGISFATAAAADQTDRTTSSEPPPNLLFLEVLEEFTKKLLKQDRRVVLDFLNSKVHTIVPSRPNDEWKPLLAYRQSLLQGGIDEAPATKRGVAEDNIMDEAGDPSVQEPKGKQKRVANKNPLPVTKVAIPRGPRTMSLSENINFTITPDSPLPPIEYLSLTSLHDADNAVDSIQDQSKAPGLDQNKELRSSSKYSRTELYADEDLMDFNSQ